MGQESPSQFVFFTCIYLFKAVAGRGGERTHIERNIFACMRTNAPRFY